MIPLSIESEWQVVRLKFYLEKNPQEAMSLAIQHYEDFLALVAEHKKLKSRLEDMENLMLDLSESYGL